jgi:hypothetical protein
LPLPYHLGFMVGLAEEGPLAKLFNKDSGSSAIELDISLDDVNMNFVWRIQEFEVKDAFKRMKGVR